MLKSISFSVGSPFCRTGIVARAVLVVCRRASRSVSRYRCVGLSVPPQPASTGTQRSCRHSSQQQVASLSKTNFILSNAVHYQSKVRWVDLAPGAAVCYAWMFSLSLSLSLFVTPPLFHFNSSCVCLVKLVLRFFIQVSKRCPTGPTAFAHLGAVTRKPRQSRSESLRKKLVSCRYCHAKQPHCALWIKAWSILGCARNPRL